MNTLCYGDNPNILRDYIKDESVDLIYLDPPFNSNRKYNVLFNPDGWNKDYRRIQILTVEYLLNCKTVDLPPNLQTFKQAGKVTAANTEQGALDLGE